MVPTSCHPAHAVTGAINLASTVSIPGTVADGLTGKSVDAGTVKIEHPGGVIELAMTLDGDAPVGARLTSTARKLSDGTVFFEFTDNTGEK